MGNRKKVDWKGKAWTGPEEGEKIEFQKIGSAVEKPTSATDVIFRKTNIVVESSGSNLSYLLFGLRHTCDKYSVTYENCLVLMYLEELGVFPFQIDILNETLRVSDYIKKELVMPEYSGQGKNLYKLSMDGLEIVANIKKILEDESRFVSANRVVDIQTDKKVKGTLFEYFDIKTLDG